MHTKEHCLKIQQAFWKLDGWTSFLTDYEMAADIYRPF